jgi:hypothetical protein
MRSICHWRCGALGMVVLIVSYLAACIEWFVAVLQSIIFYCDIALGPLFAGFLMIRGLEGISKGFILSFVAVAMWRLVFLAVGLITQMLIGLGTNSGNNAVLATGNAAGGCLLWLLFVSCWVVFGSVVGPWWFSKAFLRGANGVGNLMFAAGNTGIRAAQLGGRAVGAAVSGSGSVYTGATGGARTATNGGRRFPS